MPSKSTLCKENTNAAYDSHACYLTVRDCACDCVCVVCLCVCVCECVCYRRSRSSALLSFENQILDTVLVWGVSWIPDSCCSSADVRPHFFYLLSDLTLSLVLLSISCSSPRVWHSTWTNGRTQIPRRERERVSVRERGSKGSTWISKDTTREIQVDLLGSVSSIGQCTAAQYMDHSPRDGKKRPLVGHQTRCHLGLCQPARAMVFPSGQPREKHDTFVVLSCDRCWWLTKTGRTFLWEGETLRRTI